jgi:Xaa-Pro aminopeptidase
MRLPIPSDSDAATNVADMLVTLADAGDVLFGSRDPDAEDRAKECIDSVLKNAGVLRGQGRPPSDLAIALRIHRLRRTKSWTEVTEIMAADRETGGNLRTYQKTYKPFRTELELKDRATKTRWTMRQNRAAYGRLIRKIERRAAERDWSGERLVRALRIASCLFRPDL